MNDGLVPAIQETLPEMPEEVAASWLAPHAARPGFGWPPPAGGTQEPWSLLLMGRPLQWWHARLWHQEALPITFEYMSNATRFQVTNLCKAHAEGRDHLDNSRRRIDSALAYLTANGTWPGSPVAYPDADGLGLADGHHRLAALQIARAEGRTDLQDRHSLRLALPHPDARE